MAKTTAPRKPKKLAVRKATIKNLSVPKAKSEDVKGGVGGAYTFTCVSKCNC